METGNRNATAISYYCYQPELNTCSIEVALQLPVSLVCPGLEQLKLRNALPFPQFALLR
jgi:hypothetical protein